MRPLQGAINAGYEEVNHSGLSILREQTALTVNRLP